jgi:hypothetical protein
MCLVVMASLLQQLVTRNSFTRRARITIDMPRRISLCAQHLYLSFCLFSNFVAFFMEKLFFARTHQALERPKKKTNLGFAFSSVGFTHSLYSPKTTHIFYCFQAYPQKGPDVHNKNRAEK